MSKRNSVACTTSVVIVELTSPNKKAKLVDKQTVNVPKRFTLFVMSKRNSAGGATSAVLVEPSSPKKKAKVVDKQTVNVPKIFTLFNKDGRPLGWVFEGFFDGREYLKKLSNKSGSLTIVGEIEFKSFSNLKTKWLPESLIGNRLWGIIIEPAHEGVDEDGSMRLFPSDQEGVPMAWAKKIAQAMMLAEVYTNIQVKERFLTKNEECDFIARCSTVSYKEAVSAVSLESVAPGLFEELI